MTDQSTDIPVRDAMGRELLDPRQAAAYLQVNEQTLRRLARENRLPAFKVGGQWRFRKDMLQEWGSARVGAAGNPPNRRVLIVDDEDAVCGLIRRILEREGYEVVTAGDGEAALDVMPEARPGMAIIDLVMPGMSGPELISRIRAEWGNLPVVILTGYPESDLLSQALQFSPLILLVKPFTRDQLLGAVKRILVDEPPDGQSPILR